jgi:type IV fimbrial biogenesis protein FimT
MVVVSILAILAALSLPAVTELLRVNRLSSASSALQVSLALARSEAIKRGGDSMVSVVSNTTSDLWTSGWTVFWHRASSPTDPAPTADVANSVTRIEVVNALSTPISASHTHTLTAFTYSGNGRLIDPSGGGVANRAFWFFDGDSDKFCVIVNNTGRVRVERVASTVSCATS